MPMLLSEIRKTPDNALTDNLNDLKSNYNTYIKRLGDRGWKR